jgi:hypothetical protein
MAHDAVRQLLATDVALDKLGAHGISAEEAEQLPRNRHVTARNPRERADSRQTRSADWQYRRRPTSYAGDRTNGGPNHLADRDWVELDGGRA